MYPWNNADRYNVHQSRQSEQWAGKVAEDSRFNSCKRQNFFSPKSTHALRHVTIHWVLGDITLGIKPPKRGSEHLPPSSVDVNPKYTKRGPQRTPPLVCYWLTSVEINKHKIFDTNNA